MDWLHYCTQQKIQQKILPRAMMIGIVETWIIVGVFAASGAPPEVVEMDAEFQSRSNCEVVVSEVFQEIRNRHASGFVAYLGCHKRRGYERDQ